MNEYSNIQSSGLLKNDYGAKNPTEEALKKRRKALYDTKMGNDAEELEEEIQDDEI